MSTFEKYLPQFLVNAYMSTHFSIKSAYETIKTKRKLNVIIENVYNAGPLVVMALYEKHTLRPDIKRYLLALKNAGAFVVAANTSTLSPSELEENRDLFGVYIERDNLGRDFGSYKDAFEYIYKKGNFMNCHRVIMCNDSVYYSTEGLDNFIEKMISTDKSVLGATENYDYHRHLGSFYISLSQNIFSSKAFMSYWRNYKKTNVRPRIIKTGELALSKTLSSLVRYDRDFDSLYNINLISNDMDTMERIKFYLDALRAGDVQHHSSLLQQKISTNVVTKSELRNFILKKNKLTVPVHPQINRKKPVDFLELSEFIESITEKQEANQMLKDALRSICLECYSEGSQIHFNAIVYKKLGLPILKLDIMHRHAYSVYDFLRLSECINIEQEQEEYKEMMLSKMSGRNFLRGFRRRAFIEGYI